MDPPPHLHGVSRFQYDCCEVQLTLAVARRTLVALALLFASLGSAAAQSVVGCRGPGCTLAPEEIAASTARIAQLKQEFATALNQFLVGLTGFGADRRAIQSRIESMDRARVQWEGAITEFETALTQSARSADGHVALAKVYLERHHLDDALRELGNAVVREPQSADIHSMMSLAYRLADRPSDAAQELLKAAVLDPDNPATWYELARNQMKTGKITEAQTARVRFRELLDKRLAQPRLTNVALGPFDRAGPVWRPDAAAPVFPPALYASGFGLLARGAYAEAMISFREAASADRLSADSAEAADPLSHGRAALGQGDLPSALKHLENAVATAADRVEVRRVLGAAYWADGQSERSVEQLTAAIRLDPQDERAWMALADILATIGRFSEAEQVLKGALQVIAGSGQAHFGLGRLYRSLGRYSDAAGELEEAAKVSPPVGQDALYEMIEEIYLTLAAFDRAAEACAARVDLNPNSAQAHRRLGEVYLRQDRDDEALTEFMAALLIDPRDSAAFGWAAQIHLRTGRYAEAAEASRRALQHDPALKEARYALGTALMRLGQVDEGVRHIEAFQNLQAEATARARRKHELERLTRDASVAIANADYEKSAALLRQAISYESEASTFLALGFSLMAAGHHAEAIKHLQKAAQLEDGPDVHRYLAEAYRALGRMDDSQSEAQVYMRMIERAKKERLRKMIGAP